MTKPKCCAKYSPWEVVLTVIICLIALGVIGVITGAFISQADKAAKKTHYIEATGDRVIPGPGNAVPNARLYGQFQTDANARRVSWKFIHSGLSTITAIHIRGPLSGADPLTAPLYFSLCGAPSMMACDISVAGEVNGELLNEILPSQESVRPFALELAENWHKYYLESLTNDFPAGAVRSPLGPPV